MARIVLLGSAHPLRGGGLATFNERLARAFMEQGHEVTIYTFSLQYPGVLFPGKSQYSDDPPPADLDIRIRVNSINPVNWYQVGHELKRLQPDLLIIRYWLPFMAPCLGTIAAITKKNKHTRVITIADNVIPHEKRPGDTRLTKYFLKRVHASVSMSDTVRKDLLHLGVSPDTISFCPHPLYDNFGPAVSREEARRVLKLDANDKLLLFFGFIRDYKGLDLLLEALAKKEVTDLPVKLLVAGEFYTDARPYYQLAERLGITGHIIWHTDFIPNDRVKYYFCAADLVAQPYKSATQSGVTQVAYHFEKPMLVTNVGGLPEMVADGKAGYVVNPDADAIASAILAFFHDDNTAPFRDTLKEEKKRFSWDRLVDTLFTMADRNRIG
ncbi:MAG: glycosyltransferase [Bacteroidales bacterium]